jgi:hypothetical protein
MITLGEYWMGRNNTHPADLTEEITSNATLLLERVNRLLQLADTEDVGPGIDAATGTFVASGWRPPSVNDATSNAAQASRHITGRAIDLRDHSPDRALARWCLRNRAQLEAIGLWMEDPQWTPSWVHLQCVPPGSGRRVYVPSSKPALVAALPEQLIA